MKNEKDRIAPAKKCTSAFSKNPLFLAPVKKFFHYFCVKSERLPPLEGILIAKPLVNMKAIHQITCLLGLFLLPPLSLAQDYITDYPGEFHSFSFSNRGYQLQINIYASDEITWVDFLKILVETTDGQTRRLDTHFIDSALKYVDPDTGKQGFAVFFKDNSQLVMARDGSFLRFLPHSRAWQYQGDYQYRIMSPSNYHSRFPTAFERSPLFVFGTRNHIRRQPRFGRGWDPLELKLHLIHIGEIKVTCDELLDLSGA